MKQLSRFRTFLLVVPVLIGTLSTAFAIPGVQMVKPVRKTKPVTAATTEVHAPFFVTTFSSGFFQAISNSQSIQSFQTAEVSAQPVTGTATAATSSSETASSSGQIASENTAAAIPAMVEAPVTVSAPVSRPVFAAPSAPATPTTSSDEPTPSRKPRVVNNTLIPATTSKPVVVSQ